MTRHQPLLGRQRRALLIAVMALLSSVYLITYSGRIESGDTLALFDALGSLVQQGDLLLDISASDFPPDPGPLTGRYPLRTFSDEPLPLALAAPLYGLAYLLPGIGLVHSVWVFNAFVSALTGGILFVYALSLGYGERTATAGALLLGLTTILWVYSQTFFREPLLALLLLLAALLGERWRAGGCRSWWLAVGALLAAAGAWLTKEAAVLALPGLFLLLLPPLPPRLRMLNRAAWLPPLALASIWGLLLLAALAGDSNPNAPVRVWMSRWIEMRTYAIWTAQQALHTYLVSPGGSIWGTSPMLLLGVVGGWRLLRRGQGRYPAALAALLLSFAGGYALLRGEHWFGGLSWPPRFLAPIVPLLALAALPVLDAALTRSRGWRLVVIALAAYGFWIQVCGVSLPWGAYTAALPAEANGLGEWGGGLNVLRYLRWVVIPGLWGQAAADFAWARAQAWVWPVGFSLVAGLAALAISGRWPALKVRRWRLQAAAVLPAALAGMTLLGLRLIYLDPLYLPPSQAALFELLPALAAEAQAGDVLVLSGDAHRRFFLNHGKFAAPRVVSLPPQPGEQPSPEQPPLVRATNPDALLVKSTIPLLHNLAAGRDRLWLLADAGPWLPWSVRPVERFMTAHYYLARETTFDPTVRWLVYNTTSAPDPFTFRGPETAADLVFGGQVRLVGCSLPGGSRYRPDDWLPLSLYWQAQAPVERDYVVAWFVAAADGAVIAQGMDAPPGGGFAPTSGWQVGAPVWDHRALRLPQDLAPGIYRLWVRMYSWDPVTGIELLPAAGANIADSTTGVLPVVIAVDA